MKKEKKKNNNNNKKPLASKSKSRKGSKKKLMETPLIGFHENPKTVYMCIFLRGSMLPSNSQGV